MSPRISAADIIDKWETVQKGQQTEEYFYNKVLGLPYASSDSKVGEEDILGSITYEENPMDSRMIIGVDTGIKLRFVLMNKYGVVGYGEKDNWEPREPTPDDPRPQVHMSATIEGLLVQFPEAIMVIDAGGDIKGTRELQEKYPTRVFLCYYRIDTKSKQIIRWGEKKEMGTVMVDRNRMLSLIVSEFKDKRVRLYNGSREDYQDYWLHWSHIQRTTEESNVGTPQYVWIRTDRDDWVHAHLYARVGLDKFGFSGGGKILGLTQELRPNSYMVNPNMTVNVSDVEVFNKKYDEQEEDWRNM
jgi:hypothetical protein